MIWLRILELAVLFGSLVRGQQTCDSFSVGISNRDIHPDERFTASSFLASNTRPFYARINEHRGQGVWCAKEPFENQWLEVDLGRNFAICGVLVQRGYIGSVTKFKMAFSPDRGDFTTFERELTGPAVQQEEAVFDSINPYQVGRYIRILPTAHDGDGLCLRFDLYGFPAPKITCNRHHMLVEFDKNEYIDLVGSNMHLIDESCGVSSENATHILLRIPLDRCGTMRSTRDDDFLYQNEVIRKIDASAGLVTKQMDLAFRVECFYDRDYAVGGVNYTVEDDETATTSSTTTASKSGSSPHWTLGGRVYNQFFVWVLGLGLPAVWLCLLGVVG